ncbi:MAG: hypothetical protein IJ708_03860 [Clostridia bacterium]|nr:hypothetical protein [Clostridia bacterium]
MNPIAEVGKPGDEQTMLEIYQRMQHGEEKREDPFVRSMLSVFDDLVRSLPSLAARMVQSLMGEEGEILSFGFQSPEKPVSMAFGLAEASRCVYVLHMVMAGVREGETREHVVQMVLEGTASGQIVLNLYELGVARSFGGGKGRVKSFPGEICGQACMYLRQTMALPEKVRIRYRAGEEARWMETEPKTLRAFDAPSLIASGLGLLIPFLPLSRLPVSPELTLAHRKGGSRKIEGSGEPVQVMPAPEMDGLEEATREVLLKGFARIRELVAEQLV